MIFQSNHIPRVNSNNLLLFQSNHIPIFNNLLLGIPVFPLTFFITLYHSSISILPPLLLDGPQFCSSKPWYAHHIPIINNYSY